MSKQCSLNVLNSITCNLNQLQRQSTYNADDKFNSFEDDVNQQHSSDGEDDSDITNSPKSHIDAFVSIIKEKIQDVQEILATSHDGAKRTLQVSDT